MWAGTKERVRGPLHAGRDFLWGFAGSQLLECRCQHCRRADEPDAEGPLPWQRSGRLCSGRGRDTFSREGER